MKETVLTGRTLQLRGADGLKRQHLEHRHCGEQNDSFNRLAPKSAGKEASHARPTFLGLRLTMEKQFSSSLRQGGRVHLSLLNVSFRRALGVRGGQLLARQSLP